MPAAIATSGPGELHPPNPEPHSTHIRTRNIHTDMQSVAVDLRVNEVPRHGLRFFALQTNFGDGAGAHGGPQADPENGKANWGGLSKHGYDTDDRKLEALRQIQNVGARTFPTNWAEDAWYTLKVSRGERVTLPPGKYSVFDEPPIDVPFEREMTRWNFTMTPRDGDGPTFEHHLFAAGDTIKSFTYWTETGYGVTCDDRLDVEWENPRYVADNDGQTYRPILLIKSLYQTYCDPETTTDIQLTDEDTLRVRQTYGGTRRPDSHDGQVMWVGKPGPIEPDADS